MNDILNLIKGIHPGKFLERELKKRNIKYSETDISETMKKFN